MKNCPRFLLILLLLLAGIAAPARADKDSPLRTVRGTVVDHADTAIASAIVYLQNLKTQTVKTYIADEAGHYRFSGLDPNVDYQIYAEHDGLTSARRNISSLDDRKDIVVILKVDKKKTSH